MERIVKVIAVLFLLLGCQNLFSQSSFYITSVKGKIVRSDGSKLVPGMMISPKEILTFSDSLSSANAIDDKSTVFIMAPLYLQAGFSDAASEVAKLVRKARRSFTDYYVPDAPLSDLADIFGSDQFTVFDGDNRMGINSAKLKVGPNDMIVLSYLEKGIRVSKRLPVEKGEIVMEKAKFMIGTDASKADFKSFRCTLYLVNSKTKKYTEISEFRLNLIDRQTLLGELKLVKKYLESKGVGQDLVRSYITGYFFDLYGRTFQHSFNELLKTVLES